MHTNKIIKLSLTTLLLLSLTACGRKEVVSVSVPTAETVAETVKPAEPIVVSVEPINEVKEDEIDVEALTAYPADPDIDYYSKGMDEQQKKSYSNSGSPAVDDENFTLVPSNEPLDEDGFSAQANELYGETWHVTLHGGGGDIFH